MSRVIGSSETGLGVVGHHASGFFRTPPIFGMLVATESLGEYRQIIKELLCSPLRKI